MKVGTGAVNDMIPFVLIYKIIDISIHNNKTEQRIIHYMYCLIIIKTPLLLNT